MIQPMFKLMVGNTELTPIGIGAQKTNPDGTEEVVVVEFNSTLDTSRVIKIFKSLSDDDTITIQNEKNILSFSDFVCMDDTISIKTKDDGSFDYTVIMHKKSAYEISKENTKQIKDLQSTVEYLSILNDVTIDDMEEQS